MDELRHLQGSLHQHELGGANTVGHWQTAKRPLEHPRARPGARVADRLERPRLRDYRGSARKGGPQSGALRRHRIRQRPGTAPVAPARAGQSHRKSHLGQPRPRIGSPRKTSSQIQPLQFDPRDRRAARRGHLRLRGLVLL